MELDLHVSRFDWAGGDAGIGPGVASLARRAEGIGVRTLSFMDHWFQMDWMAPATDPMLEGYTALGFVAGCTERLRLRLLVTGVTYRHPGLLAKTVTTLDVVSSGRAELGIGAAWYDREHKGLGVPFPPTAERFERLEETLQICLQMWSADDPGTYEGKHYRLEEMICSPQPVSKPRPRILIGGSGERKTLRLVAQYADACNIFGGPDEIAAQARRAAPALRRGRTRPERDRSDGDVSRHRSGARRSTTWCAARRHSRRWACRRWSPARWVTIPPAGWSRHSAQRWSDWRRSRRSGCEVATRVR